MVNLNSKWVDLVAQVEATSVMFFKRFYLSASVMDCHPKDVMLTAMWLACKVNPEPERTLPKS